jgi:hypothetical protein
VAWGILFAGCVAEVVAASARRVRVVGVKCILGEFWWGKFESEELEM